MKKTELQNNPRDSQCLWWLKKTDSGFGEKRNSEPIPVIVRSDDWYRHKGAVTARTIDVSRIGKTEKFAIDWQVLAVMTDEEQATYLKKHQTMLAKAKADSDAADAAHRILNAGRLKSLEKAIQRKKEIAAERAAGGVVVPRKQHRLSSAVRRDDLAERIALANSITQKKARAIILSYEEEIIKACCEGNRVVLPGFVTFNPAKRYPAATLSGGEPAEQGPQCRVKIAPGAEFRRSILRAPGAIEKIHGL